MTLEQECFRGDQDHTLKQRLLSQILRKLGEIQIGDRNIEITAKVIDIIKKTINNI